MMKRLLFFLFLLSSVAANAQTILDTNPAGLKWYQVNTPNFNVLYPQGFEEQAQRVANTLEHIRSAEATTLGTEPGRISIILQNQSSVSNGFVSMFPRRSEFYTMPSQNYNFLGSNDWLNLLATHEYRHVVQYRHATRGFNKLVFYLFGYPTLAGMAHAAAPDWFWEGDAVAIETAVTPSGRGRIPNFNLLFRTNLLEGRVFNYHKQYLRSYRHNIPNHYVLGYNMVSWLRRKTDDAEIWEKITRRSWSVPFMPFAFSNAVRKETGMGVSKLYREMAKDLQKEWRQQIDTLELTPFERINRRDTKAYTDYAFPQPSDEGTVLVEKSGIGDIERFCSIDQSGNETKVFTPGMMNETAMLSMENNVIVWNEFGFDPRWQMRNYSLIKAYDRTQDQKVVVGDRHSRYGGASISPDGKKIVTVRSDEAYRHHLVVISYPGGEVLKFFDNPSNSFYAMPRWSDDGSKITALKITPEGKTIVVADYGTGEERALMPVAHENTGYPVMYRNYVLFNSPATGIDNVHAIDANTGKRYQVTVSRYGAYNPAVSRDGKYLYYNDQGRDGLDVVRIPFEPSSWKEFTPAPQPDVFVPTLVEQEGHHDLLSDVPQKDYPVRRFSKLSNILNPFSWGTFIENDLSRIDLGITSQDLLSTTRVSGGYSYDINEQTGLWRAGISYQGFYPIIDFEFSSGRRSVDEGVITTTVINGNNTTTSERRLLFEWQERNIETGIRIPLVLTRSKYISNISLSENVGITRVTDFSNGTDNERFIPVIIRDGAAFGIPFNNYLDNGTLVYNHLRLSGFRAMKTSPRDIYSPFAQALTINHFSTPFGGDFNGGVMSGTASLYFPGVVKHHSLFGYFAVQEMLNALEFRDGEYFFRNTIPLPRGTSVSRFKTTISGSVNYTMPLWYPDIALGPFLNIQRVRLNVFSDYAYGMRRFYNRQSPQAQSYHTVGGELVFDLNLMRFLPQFDIGVRYTVGITPAVSGFELVLGTFNF